MARRSTQALRTRPFTFGIAERLKLGGLACRRSGLLVGTFAGRQIARSSAPRRNGLALGCQRGEVRLRWRAHASEVLSVTFSPDGLTLASTGNDKMVRIWDPVTTQPLLMLKGHEAPVHAAAFSRDGTILATGSHDGRIKLWRALPDEQVSTR